MEVSSKEEEEEEEEKGGLPIAIRDYPPGCRPAWESKIRACKPSPLVNSQRWRGKSKVDDDVGFAEGGGVHVLKKLRADGTVAEKFDDAAGAGQSLMRERSLLKTPESMIPESSEVDRARIMKILGKFDALRRSYTQMQENGDKTIRRPDLCAGSIITDKKENFDYKGVGVVPGINVGDCFFYRYELNIIGLHRQMQAGIAWVPLSKETVGLPADLPRSKETVCASIVASGGYEDDEDNGETLTYTGQGGNNYKGDRRQGKDQKPEKGNLALTNSCKRKLPVRVIRGHHKVASSPSGRVYSYDGLYMVEKAGQEVGASGFMVFKFFLRRLPGQPDSVTNTVRFMGRMKDAALNREGLVTSDISSGQEPLPVCVVNTEDGLIPPKAFQYTSRLRYPNHMVRPPLPNHCHCRPSCSVNSSCLCVRRNVGKMLPYNHDGNLVRARPIVYECGPRCNCSKLCYNRVSQRGLRHKLEIFKTKDKGWGVRSWEFIPSGGFVCEYTGDLLDSNTANELDDDEYLFNLDLKGGNEARWGDVSDVIEDIASDVPCPVPDTADYVIDASKSGGVARFINHSCEPNLFVQCVLYDHHDLRFPHIMLFASSNIPPLRELTYDYGYALDSVYDSHGNLKQKACHCGVPSCRKRLY